MEKRVCFWCGLQFVKYKENKNGIGRNKFCSSKCAADYASFRISLDFTGRKESNPLAVKNYEKLKKRLYRLGFRIKSDMCKEKDIRKLLNNF